MLPILTSDKLFVDKHYQQKHNFASTAAFTQRAFSDVTGFVQFPSYLTARERSERSFISWSSHWSLWSSSSCSWRKIPELLVGFWVFFALVFCCCCCWLFGWFWFTLVFFPDKTFLKWKQLNSLQESPASCGIWSLWSAVPIFHLLHSP